MICDLTMQDQRVLVVGGGHVAERRIRTLLSESARILVVAPEISPPVRAWFDDGHVDWDARRWQDGGWPAGDWALVVVAVDHPELSAAIVSEARSEHIPVSSAHGDGTVRQLSVRRHGPLELAVGSCGRSPALSAELADRLLPVIEKMLPKQIVDRLEMEGWPRDRDAAGSLLGGIEK